MNNTRKQIQTVVDVENINELPAVIAEFIANLGEDETLMAFNCRYGRSRKDKSPLYSLEFTTFVGNLSGCFPEQ